MKNAPKQQQFDMYETINERAAVLYMDAKGVKRGSKGLEGSIWTSDQLFNIKLESQIEDLRMQLEVEKKELQDKKDEKRRRELEKKDPEIVFKEMLYKDENLDQLQEDIWSKLE